MRARRRGHILNVTSMGGFITLPGIAWYCGSKFALEGISEVLGKEVAPFGIHVTAVAPGSFRTDWAGRSMARAPRSIDDYDALFDPIRSAREAKSGHQLGDPPGFPRRGRSLLRPSPRPAPTTSLGCSSLPFPGAVTRASPSDGSGLQRSAVACRPRDRSCW